jgi:predicted DNA-binding transcriptional regulator AlpA
MQTSRATSPRKPGTALLRPVDLQRRYGISLPTRWRWEKAGRLPPRDVFIGGVAIGWKPSTIEAAESGLS